MALLHFDGFDLGDHAAIYSLAGTTTSNTSTRFGAGRCLSYNNAGGITLAFTPAATTYIGFAYSTSVSSANQVLQMYGDSGVTEHVRLWWSNSTTLNVGRAATSLATAAVNEPVGSWVYVEVMATVADSGGRLTVKIDGQTVIDFTGDTKNAGTATTLDTVKFSTPGGGTPLRSLDDFYICDGTGAAPHNTFLGPVRVYTLSPSGAGTDTAMTPSSGANWTCVDEQPYSAADYVTGATGQRDTYALADLPSPGTIYAVQPTAIAAKTDAGALNLKTAIRSGGTVYTGNATALGSADTSVRTIRTTNPATGAAWTKAGVDALESGAEVA